MFITKDLYRLAKKYVYKLIGLGLIDLVMLLLATVMMYLASTAVDMMLTEQHTSWFSSPFQVFAVICCVIIARFWISQRKMVLSTRVGSEIKHDVRLELLSALFCLGPAYISHKRSGDLSSVVWGRVEWLNNYYGKYFPVCISTSLHSCALVAVLTAIEWRVGLASAVFLVSALCAPLCFSGLLNKYGQNEWRENSAYSSDCLDGIQGVVTLKALNANAYHMKKIERQSEALRVSIMKHLKVTIAESCTLEFLVYGGMLLTLFVSIAQFQSGQMSESTLVLLLFLIMAAFKPLFTLITAWHIGYRGVTAAQSIIDIFDDFHERYPLNFQKALSSAKASKRNGSVVAETDEANVQNHGSRLQKSGIEVDVRSVTFAYGDSEKPVLADCSCTLQRGAITALVGTSGAGKSTLSYLIAGFYPPDAGSILLRDGSEIIRGMQERRNYVAAVWQDSHLFYGTIADNIMMGRPCASPEEMVESAQQAQIHDFIIALPEGYNTHVGERGQRLSGGERQRIAIARAILRNAPVLIFDEATSALDRENEARVQQSFRLLAQNRTVLLISHRPETQAESDCVLTIRDGRVVNDDEGRTTS